MCCISSPSIDAGHTSEDIHLLDSTVFFNAEAAHSLQPSGQIRSAVGSSAVYTTQSDTQKHSYTHLCVLISLCSSMVGYHCRLYFCMELRINYKSVENFKFYFKVFCVTCCCTTTISPIHRITFTKLYITCRNCHNNLIHSLTLVFAQHCVRGNRSVNICALSQKYKYKFYILLLYFGNIPCSCC